MPLWKCNKCHHEWEGTKSHNHCDWCMNPGHIIQEKTSLERMLEDERFINRFFKEAEGK